MEKILNWDKPEKIMPIEDWKKISADGAPPGVYHPNMSKKDMRKWKAKLVGKTTKNPRVEIRKTFIWSNGKSWPDNVNFSCQMLMVVSTEEPKVLISTNGKIAMTNEEFEEFYLAQKEAFSVLDSFKK